MMGKLDEQGYVVIITNKKGFVFEISFFFKNPIRKQGEQETTLSLFVFFNI